MKPGILTPSPDHLAVGESSPLHFPEIMFNLINSDIHDTEVLCPEYNVTTCRIRGAQGRHEESGGGGGEGVTWQQARDATGS